MSLREDIAAMERHSDNGTLREWFEGTAPALDANPRVSDPSARPGRDTTYEFIKTRGD